MLLLKTLAHSSDTCVMLMNRKHAVETTEMLDFLKEIVESVPDPSAGGTIDLEAENTEVTKRKRGKGKKTNGDEGTGAPRKRSRKKKGGDDVDTTEADEDDEQDDEDEDAKPSASGSGWKTRPKEDTQMDDESYYPR